MKKVIALVLVLIMAASVVACGTQAETPATAAPAAPAADGSAAAPAAEAEKASIRGVLLQLFPRRDRRYP